MSLRRVPHHKRDRPITKAQRSRLERYGLPIRDDMTQGEADDLIGTTHAPNKEELDVLRFFEVKGLESHSETDARQAIEQLFHDPENVKRWDARPADKEQREIYAFFKVPIPRELTWPKAEAVIHELFNDEKKEGTWEAHQDHLGELEDAASEREEWFKETRECVNEGAPIYEYKKLSKKLFAQIVEVLEAKGMSLEEIADQEELVIKTAYQIDPTRSKPYEYAKPSAQIETTRQKPRKSANRQTTPLFGTPQQETEGRNLTRWVIGLLVIVGLFMFAALNK